MIQKTDAVVLHARRFRESSKIVTLYTRENGKVGVVARGAMQPRSAVAWLLQPMSVISAVIYRKEGRELQNLSKAESLERFGNIAASLERMSAGLAIVELVNATMHDEERNDELFDAIVEALRALDGETDDRVVLLWFITRLARILGYTAGTGTCGVCDEAVEIASDVAYSIPMGAPLCAEHRESSSHLPIDGSVYELLDRLQSASAADAAAVTIDDATAVGLHDALVAFVRYHVEGLRRLNVSSVMGKVMRSMPA